MVRAIVFLSIGLIILIIAGCVTTHNRCHLFVDGNLIKEDATVEDFCKQRGNLVELRRARDNKIILSSSPGDLP